MVTIPEFSDLAKKHEWLIANKRSIIEQKKATMKMADAVFARMFLMDKDDTAIKAEAVPKDTRSIKVVSIINTTKLFDSHGDVHIDGLWNKSIKENKQNYLVKEHRFNFDGIISDDVKATVQDMAWKDLGFDYQGKTQALVYTSTIDDTDKTGMFERYKANKVPQHSVGMRYVKMALAVDNKKYPEEQKAWKDYYDMIANKAEVDEAGYFWAILEAKNIEGSAVLRGSNFATPTISVQESKDEPGSSTHDEPYYNTLKFPEVSSLYNLKF